MVSDLVTRHRIPSQRTATGVLSVSRQRWFTAFVRMFKSKSDSARAFSRVDSSGGLKMGHAHTFEYMIAGIFFLSLAGCGVLATAQKTQQAAGEPVSIAAPAIEVELEPDRSQQQSNDGQEKAAISKLPMVTNNLDDELAVVQQPPEKRNDTVKKPKSGRPSLGQFKGRNHTVTIHSGEKELLFTITSADGEVLAAELSAGQLERGHPELYRIYESAVGRLWAGGR